MRKELESELYELGKVLYANKDLPMTETCMCWGFECPDTWFNELIKLTINIEKINTELINKKSAFLVKADQVKEKFSSLRFYFSVVNESNKDLTPEQETERRAIFDQVDGLIEDTIANIDFICAYCGSDKDVECRSINGWLTNVCKECYDKRNKEENKK